MRGLGLALAVVTAALAAKVAFAAPAAQPASCGKWLPPDQGVLFGAKPGWGIAPQTDDDVVVGSQMDAFEAAAGRRMTFATFSTSWHDGLPFPAAQIRTIWGHGQIPLVRVFSFPTQDFAQGAIPVSAYPGPINHHSIVAGAHDAELKAWADAARATNIPIGFDYDPEMNNAHPWGGRYDGGKTTTAYGDPNWPDGPELYRDAFRRIVTIFRQEGATNVTFFFHVDAPYGYNANSYSEPFERYQWYYPGDDYVDWIGFSIYALPSKPDGSNLSFEEKLDTFHDSTYPGAYADLTALSSRPLAINEMGFDRMPSEESKVRWVADAAAAIESGRYPRIKAINWWGDNQGEEFDAWPGSSPAFAAAYRAAFAQPFFDPKPQFGGDCLPAAPAKTTSKGRRLTWAAVPNATGYEVWRGAKRVAVSTLTVLTVKTAGSYRVRAVNPLGAGPFAAVKVPPGRA